MGKLKDLTIQLKLCFHFYRKILLVSIGLSLILAFFRYPIEAILAIKMILIVLFYLYHQFLTSKDELLFYRNFRLTPLNLFTVMVIFDLILSILSFKILNQLL